MHSSSKYTCIELLRFGVDKCPLNGVSPLLKLQTNHYTYLAGRFQFPSFLSDFRFSFKWYHSYMQIGMPGKIQTRVTLPTWKSWASDCRKRFCILSASGLSKFLPEENTWEPKNFREHACFIDMSNPSEAWVVRVEVMEGVLGLKSPVSFTVLRAS